MAGAFQSDAFQNNAFQIDANEELGEAELQADGDIAFGGALLISGALSLLGEASFSAQPEGDFDIAFQPGAFQADAFQTTEGGGDAELAVTGVGTWTAAGHLFVSGALDLTGTGAFSGTASTSDDIEGFLSVTGTGALSGAASVLISGALAVTGTGAFTADGTVDLADHNIEGELALSGAGTTTFAGSRVQPAQLGLTGTGALAAAASALEWTGALDLVAESFLTALGDRVLPVLDPEVPYVESVVDTPRDIVIRINGVDVTPIVRFSDARFQSQVNGSAAPCFFAIRDLGHTEGFTTGHEITLDVDGARRWKGYVSKVRRQYSTDVVDTTDPETTARWFAIDGVDVNVLFQKRIVYNKAHPENGILAPPPGWRDAKHPDQWAAETPAYVIVRHVLATRTDILADGVDLSGVTMTDSPNPDFAAAFTGAMTVGDFMRSVNRLLGGIFYLTPTMRLMYHPVETATTNFRLTDTPYGAGSITDAVGPQSYSVLSDATAMVNDAMVWGTAPGVSTVAFARERDTTEIARHGLWQYGEFNETMYKQASVNKRANALVYGNVASRLGAHYDRISAEATVYAPIFFLGDVVRCEQRVYDGDQDPPLDEGGAYVAINLPVRRLTITFPTPTSTRWSMLITQELDDPWNIYEFVFPRFNFGGFPRFDPPPPPRLGGGVPCSEATYGIGVFGSNQTFTGPFSGQAWPNWLPWTEPPFVDGATYGSNTDSLGVFGGNGFLSIAETAFGMRKNYAADVAWNRDAVTVAFRFQVNSLTPQTMVRFVVGAATVEADISNSVGEVRLISGSGESSMPFTSWVANAFFVATITLDLAANRIKLVFGQEGGTMATLERAADGERVGDGTYKPFLGVWFDNPSSPAVRLSVANVIGSAYADAYDTQTSLFGGGSGASGWGTPWVTYQNASTVGTDPGITYDADGSIRVANAGAVTGGHIQRAIISGAGAIDVAFSISNYAPAATNVLALHFQIISNVRRQRVFIGNGLQITTFSGSTSTNSNTTTTLFSSGNPVNCRIQFNQGTLRLKVWAAGTAEPTAWTLTQHRVFAFWPPGATDSQPLVFGLMYNGPNTTGNKVTLGDVITDTLTSPSWLVSGPAILSTTGVIAVTVGGGTARGRFKSWPFADPGDGRQYAVTWGADSYLNTGGSPQYFGEMVWGQFGNLGPGVLREVTQRTIATPIREQLIGGIAAEYDATLSGEIGMSMNGQSSGPGVGDLIAALQTYNYGLATTAPPPAVSDYFLNGRDETLYEATVAEGGAVVWQPFKMVIDSQQQDGFGITPVDTSVNPNVRYLLWGVELLDWIDVLRDAGPFDQNGVLSVHTGSLLAQFRNLVLEIKLKGTPVIGIVKPEPCLPIPTTSGSTVPQISGGPASTDFESQGVDYNVGMSYVPGSVEVTVGGELLMPLIDFTETDYVTGDITLAAVPGPTKIVHIEWTILGGP